MTFIVSLLLLLFLLTLHPAQAALENQVKNHSAPYLAMHGDDPVAWQQWNAVTLERARKENKLLFVSVGFFSCYWCHVMQRESFRNPDIAKLLNEFFIPVIVDREIDPALDARLLAFVEQFRGSAGWPLNVVVTPEGHPLLGGVYFPPAELKEVLSRLSQRWQAEPDTLSTLARNAVKESQQSAATTLVSVTPKLAAQWRNELTAQALRYADRLSGGFGEQSKFPMSPQLLALLAVIDPQRDRALSEFLQLTLERMAALGLRDHLSGGFFRYTTDPAWHAPHFEKMLYDNALLAVVYTRAARVFKREDFAQVARETLDFLLHNLRAPSGAFYSSLSAVDAQGEEGAVYLWDEATLSKVLTAEEVAVARYVWNMDGAPPFERGYLPLADRTLEQAATTLNISREQVQHRLERARVKLLAARDLRQLPIDTKVIAAWNGLALLAFSEAAAAPDGASYAQAAQQLRDALVKSLVRDGELWRINAGGVPVPSVLEDYAYVTQGLLKHAARVNNKEDFALARQLVNKAWQRFDSASGWRMSDSTLLPGGAGTMWMEDGALPSPSALLLDASWQLAMKFNDAELRQRVLQVFARGQHHLPAQAFDFASHVPLAIQLGMK